MKSIFELFNKCVPILLPGKMEGNEASLQFTQLLEQVKRISELQNSGVLEGVQDKEHYLEHLQRQAEDIRKMLARLQQSQPRSSPMSPAQEQQSSMISSHNTSSSEIYQNLGPLIMGSGLRSNSAAPPALPPKSGMLSFLLTTTALSSIPFSFPLQLQCTCKATLGLVTDLHFL